MLTEPWIEVNAGGSQLGIKLENHYLLTNYLDML